MGFLGIVPFLMGVRQYIQMCFYPEHDDEDHVNDEHVEEKAGEEDIVEVSHYTHLFCLGQTRHY